MHEVQSAQPNRLFRLLPSLSTGEMLVLSVFSVLLLFRLGAMEIQPWDEALYAIRAKVCVQHGLWLDQTARSAGGLYSASHPPLGVWAIASSYALFGISEWSARFPSAIAGIVLLVSLHLFLRKRFDTPSAMFGVVSLAASMHFLWYARLGQLDVIQLCFSSLGVFSYVSFLEGGGKKHAALAGVFTGLALATKLALSLLPCAVWLLGVILHRNRRILAGTLLAGALATVIGAPWYAYMSVTHPGYVYHAVTAVVVTRFADNVEVRGNAGIFYLTQLLYNFPLLPFAFTRSWKTERGNAAVVCAVSWLFVAGGLLTFLAGAKTHFGLHVFVPISVLIAAGSYRLRDTRAVRLALTLGGAMLLLALSLSEAVRFSLRTRELLPEAVPYVPFVAGIAALAVIVSVWISIARPKTATLLRRTAWTAAFLMLVSAVHVVVVQFPRQAADGSRAAQAFLDRRNATHLVVLYHGTAPAIMQPQLGYYLDGWTFGWQAGKTADVLGWDFADTAVVRRLESRLSLPGTAVLLVQPWGWLIRPSAEDSTAMRRLKAQLASRARVIATAGMYTMYGSFERPRAEARP